VPLINRAVFEPGRTPVGTEQCRVLKLGVETRCRRGLGERCWRRRQRPVHKLESQGSVDRPLESRSAEPHSRETLPWWIRTFGAVLALEVAWIHILDQGGWFELRDPPYLGWGYRILEAVGLSAAVLLLSRWHGRASWLMAGVVAGVPLIGYVVSRSIGLPDYPDDVGNWLDPFGVASVLAEGPLLLLAIASLVRLGRLQDAKEEDRDY
jgi:hypothetical protein